MTAEMKADQGTKTTNPVVLGGETTKQLSCSKDCCNFDVSCRRPPSVACANTCDNFNVAGAKKYQRMM